MSQKEKSIVVQIIKLSKSGTSPDITLAKKALGGIPHTIKNLIISEPDTYIRYLSPTYEGSIHDKKMADEEDFNFQQAIILIQDLGFQGFKPENVIVYQPIKKLKSLDLSIQQKPI